MKIILHILFICNSVSFVKAQEYTFTDYINKAVKSNCNTDNLLKYNFSSPLIEKLSIRTRTDDFEPSKQRLSFRTNVSSLKARKYETEYIRWQEQNFLKSAQTITTDNINSIIELWSAAYFYAIHSKLIDNLVKIYNEKENFLIKIATSDPNVIKDINDIQLKTLEIQSQKETFIYNAEIQKEALKNLISTEQLIDLLSLDEYIEISKIEEEIALLKEINHKSNDILKVENKIKENEYEYSIEKANNNKIIDYIELGLNDFESNSFKKAYTVGVGILFPTNKKKNIKLAELEIENNYLLKVLPYQEQKLKIEIENLFAELHYQIKIYQLNNKFLSKLEEKLSMKIYDTKMSNELLEILLDNKILYAEKKIELSETHQKILENYFKLHQLTSQIPFINVSIDPCKLPG